MVEERLYLLLPNTAYLLISPDDKVGLDYLPESHQQWEVDLVSVSQDLQDTIQVDLVFTEAP